MGCLPFMLCFSTASFAQGSSEESSESSSSQSYSSSSHSHSDDSHRCHGRCPLTAEDYTQGRGSRVELKVDDLLATDPVEVSLSGFTEYLGFDQPGGPTTEQYWRLGLEYVQARFGIITTNITFNPGGFAFLTVANDGTVTQTVSPGVNTNVIISPITFTGSGTYRCVEDTSKTIYTKPWCRPFVRLTEFVLTFIAPVSLGGDYGEQATGTPGGRVTVSSGGLAFGRYVIRGKDGVDRYFDMRSWIPNIAFPAGGDVSYFSERFQINPVGQQAFEEFGGSGIGTLTIVSPTGPITTPDGPRYQWYIRNDWWFGPIVSWPFLTCDNNWSTYPGNLSSILPYGSFAEPCNDVPVQ